MMHLWSCNIIRASQVLDLIKRILFLQKLCNIGSGKEVTTLLILNRLKRMRLEKEAKEFMEKKNNTTSKKLEEIFENVKLVQGLTDIILKKLKELNAKNNSNAWPILVSKMDRFYVHHVRDNLSSSRCIPLLRFDILLRRHRLLNWYGLSLAWSSIINA